MDGHVVRLPNHSAEFRRCLVDCDVQGIMRLWAHVAPKMPRPETDEDALICIHITRTITERIPFRFRAYSHSWLTERNLRSMLPDDLKPRAERMYPRIVSAVGICVATLGNRKTDYHHHVSTKLCNLVADMYADGIEDPVIISARMKELHDRLRKEK
jgi:hypothetical protein